MLNDLLRAHHAGVSKWGNATDINSSSIGIEIDNNGFEIFTEAQITSLLNVLDRLKKAYNIPVANFIGHADIAPGRKVDPNRNFPWQKLSEQGFGYWYDTTNVQVDSTFNALQALRIIGYDIKKDTSAIQSFKLHFVQNDSTKVITDTDKKILADLVKKYQ
jgi:N-acetylmuramoyl-L-alanine amidase